MSDKPKWTTPGPWSRDGLTIKSARGVIAKCPVPQDGGTFNCNKNAVLIVAAPMLYEALAGCFNLIGDIRPGWDRQDKVIAARAALAKARGETP